MIEMRKVIKRYGPNCAVDGVDLTIGSGELFGLIGHNGAGKSTLFKMMLGLIPVSAGSIHIGGQAVRGGGFRQIRRSLGYLPENIVLYDNLTGLETLQFFARLKGVPAEECPGVLATVGLAAVARQRVRGYSKGMRQRLGFAQALLGRPRLLFLDEPTNGLDPEGVREFYQLLRDKQDEGVTIVITSHILAEIQERVDRLAIMRCGKIQACGNLQALRQETELPLRILLRLADGGAEQLRTHLQAGGGYRLEQEGGQLTLICSRDVKMAVLARLANLPDLVLDLQVREPSLEDVFLGYAE
ncbi:copper ABC transporter, ATP-binding protein NosF [Pseudogulbenkiania sp. NH8B]|uniref:ABC transporter ATP-binding protein n=1 Tax=Pseudogulbenkiania sp. (strain NH8B) TaxID=748280 RepID=UPI000227A71B|nr:ABC transporter ATP-binding protein [Pseudogulbenkiania sp. NH8B]BAK78387.1 copper ABC transporter, ATP-binding protein NosF [Pseudogulbenkiania sp. NH8B]